MYFFHFLVCLCSRDSAILAQGTDWAVAVTQAFVVRGSIPAARRSCLTCSNLAAIPVLCRSIAAQQQLTRPGLEPGISGSGGRRLIH